MSKITFKFKRKLLYNAVFKRILIFVLSISAFFLIALCLCQNAFGNDNLDVQEISVPYSSYGYKVKNLNYENNSEFLISSLSDCEPIEQNCDDGDSVILEKESFNDYSLGDIVSLKGSVYDSEIKLNMPGNEICSWECYPCSKDCYKSWDDTGANMFQLVAHTSWGDAVGIATCQDQGKGMPEPGSYDIIGRRGEWSIPGDSHGNCIVTYIGVIDGYYHWKVANYDENNDFRPSENYQHWNGEFSAPAYGTCSVEKSSTCAWSLSNNNYSIGSSVSDCVHYDIFTDSSCAQYTGKFISLNNYDSDGYSWGISPPIQCGTYYIQESKTYHGKNYEWNSDIASVVISPDINTKVVWGQGSYRTNNKPLYCDLFLELIKADKNIKSPGIFSGKTNFENALFEFDYYDAYFKTKSQIDSYSNNFKRQWIMKTDKSGATFINDSKKDLKVSGDSFYFNDEGRVVCPLGTYVVHETKAPIGYFINDKYFIVQVVSLGDSNLGVYCHVYDGDSGEEISKIVDAQTSQSAFVVEQQVYRGDYKFVKDCWEDQHTLPFIPWKITSKTTGEWHVLVSDRNGEINTNSAKCNHSANTNYFDCLLTQDGKIPNNGIDENKISEFYNKLNLSGVWFGLNSKNGKMSSPENNVGALPFDDYILEELPVVANKNKTLISREFSIADNGWTVDGGTITNVEQPTPQIGTIAAGLISGTNDIVACDEEKIIDTVSYDGLEVGRQYRLKGTIIDKDTSNPISDEDGNPVTSLNKFIAKNNKGTSEVEFNVDTNTLIDKNVVVFERLYADDGSLLAVHEDINDENQTVKITAPKTFITPQTFDVIKVGTIAFLVCLSLAIFSILIYKRRKKTSFDMVFLGR